MIATKICGITNLYDAQAVAAHNASAIGFIFYEKSPRKISIEDAKFISKNLTKDISKVGIFVNHKKEFIDEAIQSVPHAIIGYPNHHRDDRQQPPGHLEIHRLGYLLVPHRNLG